MRHNKTIMVEHLERVANSLESKGFLKEAYKIDIIINTIEKEAGFHELDRMPLWRQGLPELIIAMKTLDDKSASAEAIKQSTEKALQVIRKMTDWWEHLGGLGGWGHGYLSDSPSDMKYVKSMLSMINEIKQGVSARDYNILNKYLTGGQFLVFGDTWEEAAALVDKKQQQNFNISEKDMSHSKYTVPAHHVDKAHEHLDSYKKSQGDVGEPSSRGPLWPGKREEVKRPEKQKGAVPAIKGAIKGLIQKLLPKKRNDEIIVHI